MLTERLDLPSDPSTSRVQPMLSVIFLDHRHWIINLQFVLRGGRCLTL